MTSIEELNEFISDIEGKKMTNFQLKILARAIRKIDALSATESKLVEMLSGKPEEYELTESQAKTFNVICGKV